MSPYSCYSALILTNDKKTKMKVHCKVNRVPLGTQLSSVVEKATMFWDHTYSMLGNGVRTTLIL